MVLSSFLRRTILSYCIRSQNLIPSLRSLSSDSGFDYKSIFSSDPLKSLQLTPDDTLQPVDSVSSDPELTYSPATHGIMLEAFKATDAFVDYIILCEKKTGIIYKALDIINHHSIFHGVSTDAKLEVLSTVFDRIRNYSLADSSEVTQETDLCLDLGFYESDCDRVHKALCLEFRIFVPINLVKRSCKKSIDYIYNHQSRSWDYKPFLKDFILGRVFRHAPCSVGILVDRGLSSIKISRTSISSNAAVIFIGGTDDREALAYAGRVASHHGIKLTVIRFLLDTNTDSVSTRVNRVKANTAAHEEEMKLDDEYFAEYYDRYVAGGHAAYMEKYVDHSGQTFAALRSIEGQYDLFIAGRGGRMNTVLTAGMNDWEECPELGPIGDILSSASGLSSVLIIQQHSLRGKLNGLHEEFTIM